MLILFLLLQCKYSFCCQSNIHLAHIVLQLKMFHILFWMLPKTFSFYFKIQLFYQTMSQSWGLLSVFPKNSQSSFIMQFQVLFIYFRTFSWIIIFSICSMLFICFFFPSLYMHFKNIHFEFLAEFIHLHFSILLFSNHLISDILQN